MSEEKSKDNGIVTGVLLIVAGVIALLVTFFDIEINWIEVAKLWPMLLIVFGVSLLPLSKMLKSVLVIVIILLSGLIYCNEVRGNERLSDEIASDVLIENDVDVQEFSESFNGNITLASVEINYGVTPESSCLGTCQGS